jgi:signal transduction histidine kinase
MTMQLPGINQEISNSRLRISEAALQERQQIEHDLHAGPQQQFLAVLALLGLAQEQLSEDPGDENRISAAKNLIARARGQLQNAIEEFRRVARSIYPTSLSEAGLAAAIHDLADTSPIPIWVDIPRKRWRRRAETASYFLIAEAITNVIKHARATRMEVRAREDDEHIHIDVRDNGMGGMEDTPEGLADRVSTFGGMITFNSPPGLGTVIQAAFPI